MSAGPASSTAGTPSNSPTWPVAHTLVFAPVSPRSRCVSSATPALISRTTRLGSGAGWPRSSTTVGRPPTGATVPPTTRPSTVTVPRVPDRTAYHHTPPGQLAASSGVGAGVDVARAVLSRRRARTASGFVSARTVGTGGGGEASRRLAEAALSERHAAENATLRTATTSDAARRPRGAERRRDRCARLTGRGDDIGWLSVASASPPSFPSRRTWVSRKPGVVVKNGASARSLPSGSPQAVHSAGRLLDGP